MSEDKNKALDAIDEEELEDLDELDEPLIITLEFDDSTSLETEVCGTFGMDGKEYIALIPNDDSDDIYIYGYKETEEEEGTFDLLDIDDEEEFERAVKAFESLMTETE